MARITVEDCLRKENNRFALVLLASKRAKQLLAGSTPLTDTKGNKQIVSALREIEDSHVRFMTAEEEVVAIEQERLQAEREAEMRPVEVRTNGHHERLSEPQMSESLSTQAATSAADLLFGKAGDDDSDDDDDDIDEKEAKDGKKSADTSVGDIEE